MGFLRRNMLVNLTAIDASMAATLNVTFKNLRSESSDGQRMPVIADTVQTVDSLATVPLPCKTTGTIEIECRITDPSTGKLLNNPPDRFFWEYGDGSDVYLSDAITGGTTSTSTINDYIDEKMDIIQDLLVGGIPIISKAGVLSSLDLYGGNQIPVLNQAGESANILLG